MSVVGGTEGVDAGPDSAEESNGSVGTLAATGGAEAELGPAADVAAAGTTAACAVDELVGLVGLAEDTGAAASDTDETGPAMVGKRTARRVIRCVTTLRF